MSSKLLRPDIHVALFADTQVPEKIVRRSSSARHGRHRQATCSHGASMLSPVSAWRDESAASPRMATELPKGEAPITRSILSRSPRPYRARRFTVGELLYRSINVSRDDKASRYKQYSRNYQFSVRRSHCSSRP